MNKTEYDLAVIELKEKLDACLALIYRLKTYNTKNQNYEQVACQRNIKKAL